jgi:hypothetical protein
MPRKAARGPVALQAWQPLPAPKIILKPLEDEMRPSPQVEFLEDLKLAFDAGLLSLQQCEVMDMKLANPSMTYEQILERFPHIVRSPRDVKQLLWRTVNLYHWPAPNGGAPPYLSDFDMRRWADQILEHADLAEPFNKKQARDLARRLLANRAKMAYKVLFHIRCDRLTEKVNRVPEEPSVQWVNAQCEHLGLRIATPQSLEAARRTACDSESLHAYFHRNYDVIASFPSLLQGNFDETQVEGRKRFRILCGVSKRSIQTDHAALPHITSFEVITPSGFKFDGLYILANIKKLGNLRDFVGKITFITTESGWMTKPAFLMASFFLVSQCSKYRIFELPRALSDQKILFYTDGHSSRINFRAMWLFRQHNIEILKLLAHTSHFLQPFDISVASPEKTFFVSEIGALAPELLELDQRARKKASTIRYQAVRSFQAARTKATTVENCAAGFRKAGLCPLDPSKPLNGGFVLPRDPAQRIVESHDPFGGHEILTSDEALEYFAQKEYNCSAEEAAAQFEGNPRVLYRLMRAESKFKTGCLLSPIPDMYVRSVARLVDPRGNISDPREIVEVVSWES